MGKITTTILILAALYVVGVAASYILEGTEDKIAVIHITGPITTADYSFPLGEEGITGEALISFLEKASEQKSIKGILLDINSPGGTVVASREVTRVIKSIDKPVVALIRDIGTSGAYWIASASDSIVADELSITGSIGVTASYLEFSGLLEEYGITYTQLTAGEQKEVASPFKKLTAEERLFLQQKLDLIHQIFIAEVAANRNLSLEEVKKLATGTYYLGKEAYDLGLIDALGGREEAIKTLKLLAGIPEGDDVSLMHYRKEDGLLNLVSKLETQSLNRLAKMPLKVQDYPSFQA